MKTLKLLLAAAALTVSAGVASASTFYADILVSSNQGTCTDGGITPKNANGCAVVRSDPNTALGAPDGSFFSLGDGGYITVGFSAGPFANGVATAYEITTNRTSGHNEAVEVYTVLGGVVQSFVGTITNLIGQSSVVAFGAFDAIKLVDVTYSYFGTTTSFDGFDVDAVGVSAVPLPAAGFLLLAGLGGMAVVRRKKS